MVRRSRTVLRCNCRMTEHCINTDNCRDFYAHLDGDACHPKMRLILRSNINSPLVFLFFFLSLSLNYVISRTGQVGCQLPHCERTPSVSHWHRAIRSILRQGAEAAQAAVRPQNLPGDPQQRTFLPSDLHRRQRQLKWVGPECMVMHDPCTMFQPARLSVLKQSPLKMRVLQLQKTITWTLHFRSSVTQKDNKILLD